MPTRRPAPRAPLAAVVLSALLAASPRGGAEEGPGPSSATPSRLAWKGSATLDGVSHLGQKDVTYRLTVANPTSRPVLIRSANLFLGGTGGWLTALDPDTMDGSFFRGPLEVPASSEKFIGIFAYHPSAPASHLVLTGLTSDGYLAAVTPLLREGYEPPTPRPVGHPLGVGIAGPLEVVPFSDGRRSVLVVGQLQCLTCGRPESVKTSLLLGDGGGALDPVVFEGLGGQEDRERLWPFVRRIDVPEGFTGGVLRVRTTGTVDGVPATFDGEWPVTETTPVVVKGPVLGAWQVSNGPGQRDLHPNYRKPEWRWSYDFVMVEQGSTYRGEPHKRESYFAWNRSVRAVAGGTVVDKCDSEMDNPGLGPAAGIALSDSPCHVNRLVIEHDDGVRTVYLHLRQRSIVQGVEKGTRVEAGQVIARVGNSGNSTEPHLHLVAWRLDATGRPRPVPIEFSDAFEDPAGERPVRGVPVGGRTLHFINR